MRFGACFFISDWPVELRGLRGIVGRAPLASIQRNDRIPMSALEKPVPLGLSQDRASVLPISFPDLAHTVLIVIPTRISGQYPIPPNREKARRTPCTFNTLIPSTTPISEMNGSGLRS